MAQGARDGEAEGPRLAELISCCDALTVESRLRLAGVLGRPGRLMPFRPEELAACPLPRSPDARAALGRAVVAGLGPDVLARLAHLRIDAVFPAIAGRAGGVAALPVPARLLAVLERAGAATWAALGRRSVGRVTELPGVGPATATILVRLCVEAGLQVLAPSDGAGLSGLSGDEAAPAADPAGDLALLLAHERADPGEGAGLRSAIQHLAGPSRPPPVRAAARRLLAMADGDGPGAVLAAAGRALDVVGDARDRVVLERGALVLDGLARPRQLGADLGVSAERARQLRCRAEERVRAALRDGPSQLNEAVAELASRLGAARDRPSVHDLLEDLGLPGLGDPRSLLVLWLAGPYRPVAGHPAWLATDPDDLAPATRRLLGEDGGVRPVEHVVKEIERMGLATDAAPAWLAEQPVRLHQGLVVLTAGAPADVAERALAASGQAMTPDELAGWMAVAADGGWAEAAGHRLRQVLRRDRRFVEVGPDRYEPAEWGSPPYPGDVLFGAEAEAEGRWGRGQDGRWWLRVVVGDDVLAGAAAPVPAGLVAGLGVGVGARRPYSTRYGPVMLTHAADGPARGSLRPVALAAGAAAGDALVLRFSPDDDVAVVELVPAAAGAR